MVSVSLALKTVKKAQKLLEADRLQKIDDSTYLVYGSTDSVYEVSFNANSKTVACSCVGFKIKRDCYHCEAIRRKEEI